MNKIVLILISFSLVGVGFAQTTKPAIIKATPLKAAAAKPVTTTNAAVSKTATPVSVVLKTTKDSASYALGFRVAQSMKGQGLQDINMALFEKGFSAGVIAKSIIPDSLLDVCIKKYQDNMSLEKITFNRAVGKAFLEENAKKPGVVKMTNGMQYEVMVAGTGSVKPTLNNKVRCHYHGTLIDGTVFDSSVQRGEPITFPLNGVIKGWQDAVQLMTVGSKWKLFIPSELAYGERSAGPFIGPGMTLIFEVELLGIE
ncbi:MAG: FKBP-type peptidyl-prolyl cis-trans isomerase [Bacteroidetes bacterium]|nr:FKBP-type peptidyl-prolyl cis-trans isomerase [Bacteroidota bacterium]